MGVLHGKLAGVWYWNTQMENQWRLFDEEAGKRLLIDRNEVEADVGFESGRKWLERIVRIVPR